MAEKAKTRKVNKTNGGGKVKKRRRRKTGAAPEVAKERARAKRSQSPSALDVFKYVLPIISIVIAFAAVTLLYRRLLPAATSVDETTAAQAQPQQVAASTSATDGYQGVKDKWVSSGWFTTGNAELDKQVKQFCDALSVEGATARTNANTVYNNIVWSGYEERTEEQQIMGADWDIVAARHFFSTGDPESGVGGSGDAYEFSAATAFCLRYFGFSDALAVPILRGDSLTGQASSALVLVTDDEGKACVCDTTLGVNGWMLDRGLYDIVVEDIGQNMEPINALGLYVQQKTETDEATAAGTESAANGTEDLSASDETAQSDYGYDTTGY